MAKIDFGDEDAVLEEMAHALDIDPDELRIKEDRGLSGFLGSPVYEITIRGGRHGKEWHVVEDEDQMRDLAIEIVKQDLDEDPSMFEPSFIESHIDVSRLRRDLESDVVDSEISRLEDAHPDDFWTEYARAGFDEPEEDEDGDRRDPDHDEIEELAQHLADEQLKDPMQYLEDIYGREDAVKKAIEIARIDIDAAAEDIVDTDGPEHFVARYDGNSSTTKNGLVYWRSN